MGASAGFGVCEVDCCFASRPLLTLRRQEVELLEASQRLLDAGVDHTDRALA